MMKTTKIGNVIQAVPDNEEEHEYEYIKYSELEPVLDVLVLQDFIQAVQKEFGSNEDVLERFAKCLADQAIFMIPFEALAVYTDYTINNNKPE